MDFRCHIELPGGYAIEEIEVSDADPVFARARIERAHDDLPGPSDPVEIRTIAVDLPDPVCGSPESVGYLVRRAIETHRLRNEAAAQYLAQAAVAPRQIDAIRDILESARLAHVSDENHITTRSSGGHDVVFSFNLHGELVRIATLPRL